MVFYRFESNAFYIYPENNPKSPIAMATFVYQIDRPEGREYNEFARTEFQTNNFDVYDEYRLDQRSWLEQVFSSEKPMSFNGLRKNEI